MPHPDVAFSPDGDFPVINREKGIYHFDINLGKLPQGLTITAGDRANVVPSACSAKLPAHLINGTEHDGISVTVCDGVATVSATGKAAHASTPEEGINATHPVLKFLYKIYPNCLALDFLANKVCDTTGGKWGIILHDEQSGNLTCNLGVLRTSDDGTLTATVDIRFPISYNCQYMTELLRKCTPQEFILNPWHISDPLYVPAESNLVTTLMSVYNTATNSNPSQLQ